MGWVRSHFFFVLTLILTLAEVVELANPNCVFYSKAGDVFDLEQAMKRTPAKKWLTDIEKGKFIYEYDPCEEFDASGKGDGKYLIWQKQKNTELFYPLGKNPSLTQTGKDYFISMKSESRQTIIHLVCNKSIVGEPEFTGEKEDPIKTYHFKFIHVCACPNGCVSGLSFGSILLIVVFVALVLYFVLGIVYRKYFRYAEGADVIPHKEFWTSYPGLVKDGLRFIRGAVQEARGVDSYNTV